MGLVKRVKSNYTSRPIAGTWTSVSLGVSASKHRTLKAYSLPNSRFRQNTQKDQQTSEWKVPPQTRHCFPSCATVGIWTLVSLGIRTSSPLPPNIPSPTQHIHREASPLQNSVKEPPWLHSHWCPKCLCVRRGTLMRAWQSFIRFHISRGKQERFCWDSNTFHTKCISDPTKAQQSDTGSLIC